ncbi:MAG: phosphoenolpyruvate--protein phosphotransferase [Deltaproteobacteria bacterium]|jgi:phosphotransferase system enzyme I (PtsI)|nr:phosphoenolpyruvate--protein phosphotransferase [Deltaproteobacteria bacterium]
MQRISIRKPASKGIAIGEAYLYRRKKLEADRALISPKAASRELGRFQDALASARRRIAELGSGSEIFEAHLEIADDPYILETVAAKITGEFKNAELALEETADEIMARFSAIDDEYLRERAADVADVCGRVMRRLKGVPGAGAAGGIDRPVVLVADLLTPSDAAGLDRSLVLGIITAEGGNSGHVAILARGLGLPAVVGASGITDMVPHGSEIILDAVDGEVIVDPDDATREEYSAKARDYRERRRAMEGQSGLPAVTADGRRVLLCANVGSLADVRGAAACGIDGVGLFRTEFLYMERDAFPGEEDQFAAYKAAVQAAPGFVAFRTLDVGGDKELPYFPVEGEDNPALGWRGIRMCLDMTEAFKTQLRALLRASAFGDARIMFPMISSVDELDRALGILAACRRELEARGSAFRPDLKAGMMVETPAAVMCADEFAARCDFFSIGTNDLTQYVLAVDRGNRRVAGSFDPLHPAVLRSVAKAVEAGRAAGIPVAMCGELAGNESAAPLLLGLGLDELSMTAAQIPDVRSILRARSYSGCRELAGRALSAATAAEAAALLGDGQP